MKFPRNPATAPVGEFHLTQCVLHGPTDIVPCPACARLWSMVKADTLDYRAMLARTLATKNGNANGYSHVPGTFVAWELSQPELWREFFERDYSGDLA